MRTSRPKIIITGANGFLGSTLVKSFKNDGCQVVALVRHVPTRKPAGVDYVEYDLARSFDDSAFAGAAGLIHTAYVKNDHQHPDAFKINVNGAKRLLKASRKHKIKRNIFMSSMSAHDTAESIYAKQKLAIEKVFKDKDCTVIRSGLIIGNGGMVKQMTDFMRSKHIVPLIGGGKQPLQVVAVYDLVSVMKAILAKNRSGRLVIATPQVYSYKTFYQKLSKQLGIRVVFIPVPLNLLLGATKATSALRLPFSINSDNVLGLKNLRSMETAKDLKSIGIELDDLDTILSKKGFLS